MIVNYNGSIGYGQDFVNALLGKVGTLDVNDVQVCVCAKGLRAIYIQMFNFKL